MTMSITFQTRKNGTPIDASFYLKENGVASSPDWHIGDTVCFCFAVPKEQSDAIRNAYMDGIHVCDKFVSIPCKVLKRSHSVVWKQVGIFETLTGTSITLEAESGNWEDVLLWIVKNEKPEWIEV
jgi:hypothetical protein